MTRNVGIIYCQRIQDASCIGCAKCYKAVREHDHAFADVKDDIQVVFKTGCGDCPGLVLPRLELQMVVLEKLGLSVDDIYFGTCVKKATALMNCPMNLDGIEGKIKELFGLPVHVGTHDY